MTTFSYLHVAELEDGKRLLGAGTGTPSGTIVTVPEEGDPIRRQFHRVYSWMLPEPMSGEEFDGWLDEHWEDDEPPSPLDEAIEAVQAGGDAE